MIFGWSEALTDQNKKISILHLEHQVLTDQKQKQSAYHLAVEQVLAGQKYWDWMLNTIFKAIKRVGLG